MTMVFIFPVAVWLLLFGLYLFFAGTADSVEITAGLVCASLGAALAIGLRKVAHRRQVFERPPARAMFGPIAALVPETFGVGRQLVAAILGGDSQRGAFVRQTFDPGADDDPRSAGRRAMVVVGASLAPGSFVIRGDRSDTMILHALPPKAASRDPRWLA